MLNRTQPAQALAAQAAPRDPHTRPRRGWCPPSPDPLPVPLEGPRPHAPAGSWPSPAVPASPAGLPCGGHIPSMASAPWARGWGTALLPLWLSPRNKPPQTRRPQSQLGTTFVLSRRAAGWRGEFPIWAGPGRPLLGSLSSPRSTGAWLTAGGLVWPPLPPDAGRAVSRGRPLTPPAASPASRLAPAGPRGSLRALSRTRGEAPSAGPSAPAEVPCQGRARGRPQSTRSG